MKYYVFEGCDGSGKSTSAVKTVENLLSQRKVAILTKHPGATPLGQKLRVLLKHELGVPIDPLTGQILFLADHNSFVNSILKPAEGTDKIIVADRCNFISGVIYAAADNIPADTMISLYRMIEMPKIDILFVFWCPLEVAKARMVNRADAKCRYEEKGEDFMRRVNESYRELEDKPGNKPCLINCLGGMIKRVVRVDASKSPEEVQAFVDAAIAHDLPPTRSCFNACDGQGEKDYDENGVKYSK